jgi:prefoldin subunit 5
LAKLFPRSLLAAVALLVVNAGSSSGLDNYLYDNLQRSRDALLSQRDELQRARNDVMAQIDRLNQKAARIDQYLKQVDDLLRDVNSALDNIR